MAVVQAPKVAKFLQEEQNFVPELIVTSDAVRALETAKILRHKLMPQPLMLLNPNLYHAGFGEIQECISSLSSGYQNFDAGGS